MLWQNLVSTEVLSLTIMWIIRLGHFNILLCDINMDNVNKYVIHPKDSFKHRPIGQQRLVLFRRQKRKPQAYPNCDTDQKVIWGSESFMERSVFPLPIRKPREYMKFVNSEKACCTEICYLELGKRRGSSHNHDFFFWAEWTPSKLQEAATDHGCPLGDYCIIPGSPITPAPH